MSREQLEIVPVDSWWCHSHDSSAVRGGAISTKCWKAQATQSNPFDPYRPSTTACKIGRLVGASEKPKESWYQ